MPAIPKAYQAPIAIVVALVAILGTGYKILGTMNSIALATTVNAAAPLVVQIQESQARIDKLEAGQDALFIRIDDKLDALNSKIEKLSIKLAETSNKRQ